MIRIDLHSSSERTGCDLCGRSFWGCAIPGRRMLVAVTVEECGAMGPPLHTPVLAVWVCADCRGKADVADAVGDRVRSAIRGAGR